MLTTNSETSNEKNPPIENVAKSVWSFSPKVTNSDNS